MMMRKEFPESYDFFPDTFILPYEINLFKKQFYIKKEEKKDLTPLKENADAIGVEKNGAEDLILAQ
jgi:hypothetical protein